MLRTLSPLAGIVGLALLAACSDDAAQVVERAAEAPDLRVLSGTVRQAGGAPLERVTVRELGGVRTTTDASGQFALVGLVATDQLVLEVDGSTALAAGQRFSSLVVQVTLGRGNAHLLGRPITLPDLGDAGGAQQVVELDADGRALEAIALVAQGGALTLRGAIGTRVLFGGPPEAAFVTFGIAPVSRAELPLDLPEGRVAVAAAFVDPLRATFDGPLSLTMANTLNLPGGTELDLLVLDPASGTWVDRSAAEGRRARVEASAQGSSVVADALVATGGLHVAVVDEVSDCTTTVVGRVVDEATGLGLPAVSVALSTGESTTTELDGSFRLAGVAAYDLALGACRAIPLGFELLTPPQTGSVSVAGELAADAVVTGGETTLLDPDPFSIAVERIGSVAGRLVGDVNPNQSVRLRRLPGLDFAADVFPDADGTFFIAAVDAGAYRLSYLFAGDPAVTERVLEVGANFLTTVVIEQGEPVDPGQVDPPTALSYDDAAPVYTVGVPIPPNAPAVTGTVDAFSVVPDLPGGLVLDSATGVVSGTPSEPSAETTHLVRASNETGSASFALVITVEGTPPANLAYTENPARYLQGAPIAPNVPSHTGVVDSFSVAPPLPSGLQLNSGSGVVSGTPTGFGPQTAHQVTATNVAGSTSVVLRIEVDPAAPVSLAYTDNPASYAQGVAITPNEALVVGFADEFEVDSPLPDGLSLDASTGDISGTPNVAGSTSHVVTASNVSGSVTVLLDIDVEPAPPANLTYSEDPAFYVQGVAITPNVPAIDGLVDSFGVVPSLPLGLSLDTDTGVISGLPLQIGPGGVFTITASNSAGSTSVDLFVEIVTGVVVQVLSTPGATLGEPLAPVEGARVRIDGFDQGFEDLFREGVTGADGRVAFGGIFGPFTATMQTDVTVGISFVPIVARLAVTLVDIQPVGNVITLPLDVRDLPGPDATVQGQLLGIDPAETHTVSAFVGGEEVGSIAVVPGPSYSLPVPADLDLTIAVRAGAAELFGPQEIQAALLRSVPALAPLEVVDLDLNLQSSGTIVFDQGFELQAVGYPLSVPAAPLIDIDVYDGDRELVASLLARTDGPVGEGVAPFSIPNLDAELPLQFAVRFPYEVGNSPFEDPTSFHDCDEFLVGQPNLVAFDFMEAPFIGLPSPAPAIDPGSIIDVALDLGTGGLADETGLNEVFVVGSADSIPGVDLVGWLVILPVDRDAFTLPETTLPMFGPAQVYDVVAAQQRFTGVPVIDYDDFFGIDYLANEVALRNAIVRRCRSQRQSTFATTGTTPQTVFGTLDFPNQGDGFAFSGVAGEVVTIEMCRLDNQGGAGSTLDPFVCLEDPFGSIVAFDDDGGFTCPSILGPGQPSLIANFVLPATGTYVICASSFQGDGGETGEYELTLDGVASSDLTSVGGCGTCQ